MILEHPMKKFDELTEIIKILRSPEGCPWDREQTLYSLKSAMMEEAAELLDALDNKDIENIKEELGDLLLHVVIHSRIAYEDGLFDIEDVIDNLNEKLIRRHPHVFANEKIHSSAAVIKRWDEVKAAEQKTKPKLKSILDKTPNNLPSLLKSENLQKRAAKYGFDWENIEHVFNKLDEEVAELKNAYKNGSKEQAEEELGDVIFSAVNIGRHLNFSADEALRMTNNKFKKRFAYIEEQLEKQGKNLKDATLEEMDKLWNEAKTK